MTDSFSISPFAPEPASVFAIRSDIRDNQCVETRYHYDDKHDYTKWFYLSDGEVVGHKHNKPQIGQYDTLVQIIVPNNNPQGKIIITKDNQSHVYCYDRKILRVIGRVGWDNNLELCWSFKSVNDTVPFQETYIPNTDEKIRERLNSNRLHTSELKPLTPAEINQIHAVFPEITVEQLSRQPKHPSVGKIIEKYQGHLSQEFIDLLKQTNWVIPDCNFHHLVPLSYSGGNNVENIMLVDKILHLIIHDLTTNPLNLIINPQNDNDVPLRNIVRNIVRVPILPPIIVSVKELCQYLRPPMVLSLYSRKMAETSKTEETELKNICMKKAYRPHRQQSPELNNQKSQPKLPATTNTPTQSVCLYPNSRFNIQFFEKQNYFMKQLKNKVDELEETLALFMQSIFFLLDKEQITNILNVYNQLKIKQEEDSKKNKNTSSNNLFQLNWKNVKQSFKTTEKTEKIKRIIKAIQQFKQDAQKTSVPKQASVFQLFLKRNTFNGIILKNKNTATESICYDISSAIQSADDIMQSFSDILKGAYQKDSGAIHTHYQELIKNISHFQHTNLCKDTNDKLHMACQILNHIIPRDLPQTTPNHPIYSLYNISDVLSAGSFIISSNESSNQPVMIQAAHTQTSLTNTVNQSAKQKVNE